jgi:hypothetical protein
MADKISEDEKEEVKALVKDLREKSQTEDVSEIESSMKSLFERIQAISTRIYSQENEQSNQEDVNAAESKAETEEVEFEEVKG